jgi:hypothetical protein
MRYHTGEPHIRHGVHSPFRQDAAGVWRAAVWHSVITLGAIGQTGEALRATSTLVVRIGPLDGSSIHNKNHRTGVGRFAAESGAT